MHPRLSAELRALEERLLRPEVRRSAAEMAALLDDGFLEIGSSGRAYDKTQVLAALKDEAAGTRLELSAFSATALGEDAALVTFRLSRRDGDGPAALSLRASVWRRTDGAWRLLYHQGTRLP